MYCSTHIGTYSTDVTPIGSQLDGIISRLVGADTDAELAAKVKPLWAELNKASSRTYRPPGATKQYSRVECTQLQSDAMRGHFISNEHFSVIKMATTELQGNICVWCGGPLTNSQNRSAMFVWLMTWKIDFQDQESGGLFESLDSF
jgi:hypothetical protein